jgi:hypothetical protein
VNVNKAGQDWLLIKAKLHSVISEAHALMEFGLPVEEYHRAVGRVATARELIEWVEPTTPPVTSEDDYGISTPLE